MKNKYHFIGIGGIGMSGLARLLLNKQDEVSGSDIAANAVTNKLSESGATIHIGHSEKYVNSGITVIYGTDIKKENPEYQQALKLKCQMLHRSELLQQIMSNYKGLAVAGTHGKTTTSSLLTWVLECSGESPSYAIGGVVPQLSSNAGYGKGKYFVAEACESDGTFLNYTPFGAIVTNIDFDHMDFYHTEKALVDSFSKFLGQVTSSSHLFWCGDDKYMRAINPKGISYGFGENCALKVTNFKQHGWSLSYDASINGKQYRNIEVSLTGKHNALNSLAVFGLALSLGIEESQIRQALKSFGGVLRRCEKKGEVNGILFLDDYAHHPTEICATLDAIRGAIGERRLIVVFQPHRYSRSKECMGLYGGIFKQVDNLFVTEIYAAREAPIPGVTHEKIVAEIKEDLGERAQFISREHIAEKLRNFLRPHDVVVTLGAGDSTKICGEVIEKFALKAPTKLKVGLVFGGMSVEHDISVISSRNIFAAMKNTYYDIEQFGITRQGNWVHGSDAREHLKDNGINQSKEKISADMLKSLLQCDILFPVLHGTYGEDGTIQGFFDILGKAYVGCDHSSSSICMDKVLSKRLAIEAGLPTAKYISFVQHDWSISQEVILKKIENEVRYPLYVKPVHLGSSIGVRKVNSKNEICEAIEYALRFDHKIVVENGFENIREIEFSVFGNDEITVFPPGEIFANGRLHDYDSKYGLNPKKAAAEFDTHAKLTQKQIDEGMALAKSIYKTLGCCGMARIDTFLDSAGKFWFNEINPIPGFTNTSLYHLMCKANGLLLEDLIDKLVILGMQRKRKLERLEVQQ